jgi:D-serine deaminase-like pyridoxal phosphate-dependent protein
VTGHAEYERLETAFGGVEPPFAVVDLDALRANAARLARRAAGKPVRVAPSRALPRAAGRGARPPGFRGLMTFTLREALWLHGHGFEDLLLGYPTA